MSPSIPSARTRLSYPLYGADFDPLNQDFLLVGGGGGSAPTGVPNKVTLIDTSRGNELSEIVDIELSKSEDAVQSLAIAQSSETTLIAYAGINGTSSDIEAGKNEHLRSFRIDLPRKRKTDATSDEKITQLAGKTEALGRASFFTSSNKNIYQRILRLSPVDARPRVAAIATGEASENEIVIFQAGPAPGKGNELARLSLVSKEAVDLDLAPTDDGTTHYTLGYCSEYSVSLYSLSGGKSGIQTNSTVLYNTPEASGSVGRPKFRCLRFLSPRHILLVQNRSGGTVELMILRISSDGSTAQVTLQKRLSKVTKRATGLDVCILSESLTGERQILIAVVGNTNSIELLSLEYSKRRGMSTFQPYSVLRDVHSNSITRIVFSTFVHPKSTDGKDSALQTVKLASVGVDNNVVVHTLPLRAYPPTSKTPRYVLVSPMGSGVVQTTFSVFMAMLVIGIAAFMLQVFSEIRGAAPPLLGASEWLPPVVKDVIARPGMIFAEHGPVIPSEMPPILRSATEEVKDAAETTQSTLEDLVFLQQYADVGKAIVVRDEGHQLSTELHHDAEVVEKESVKKWEDLKEHEKAGWKKKLIDAGHWTEGLGENVLKGVFFSELAGLAAEMARG